MRIPKFALRRLDWRLGFQKTSTSAAELELQEALASLPSDIDPDELREFIRGGDEEDVPADPLFKARLRALLWGLVSHRHRRSPGLPRQLN